MPAGSYRWVRCDVLVKTAAAPTPDKWLLLKPRDGGLLGVRVVDESTPSDLDDETAYRPGEIVTSHRAVAQ